MRMSYELFHCQLVQTGETFLQQYLLIMGDTSSMIYPLQQSETHRSLVLQITGKCTDVPLSYLRHVLLPNQCSIFNSIKSTVV